MTLYDAIVAAFAKVPHDSFDGPELEAARKLDQQLAVRFEPILASYNDGLIAAHELLGQLYHSSCHSP